MKLVNETRYPTREIRKIITAVHAEEAKIRGKLRTWDSLRVTVKYSRRRRYWGCASYSGYTMMLTLPGGGARVDELVALVQHELWHNYGIRHGDYPSTVRSCDTRTPFVQRCLARLGFERIEEKPVGGPRLTTDERRAAKLASIEDRIKRWESKRKRAENALRKLRKQRTYYEKALASAASSGGSP